MMTSLEIRLAVTLALTLGTTAGSALAADPAPAAESAAVPPSAVSPAGVSPAAGQVQSVASTAKHELTPATDHPASVLSQMADDAHGSRITGAWASLAVGVGFGAWGAAEAASGDDGYATWWLIIGGASSLTGGLMAFFEPAEMEEFNDESGASAPGYSRAALEGVWRTKAEHARSRRHAVGAMGLTLGVIGIGAGSAIAAGAGEMSKTHREGWAVSTLAVGGSFALGGVMSLLRRSAVEAGYEAAYPSGSPTATLDFSVAPAQNGAAVVASGTF